MKKRTLTTTLAVSLLATLLAVNWFGSKNSTAQQQQTPQTTSMVPFIAANDVQFIDAIIPHHQTAVEMANEELEKGTRADVKAMAQKMKDDQTQEIAVLRGARQALTGTADLPAPPMDPHMSDDMLRLDQATGVQVDTLFLEHMIPHHAEGLSLAHRALPNLQRADVRQIATNIVDVQAREIGEMHEMRGKAGPQ